VVGVRFFLSRTRGEALDEECPESFELGFFVSTCRDGAGRGAVCFFPCKRRESEPKERPQKRQALSSSWSAFESGFAGFFFFVIAFHAEEVARFAAFLASL
jgi:hypothetical protein